MIQGMDKPAEYLVWVDCEFTGLDFHSNRIVEIAVVVTDSDLCMVDQGISMVIHHDWEELDPILEDWPRAHFEESGLLQKIEESAVCMEQAEKKILAYVSQYCEKGSSPLCGNSVGQDRRVLYSNMPEFEVFLHYRSIDVSSLKELAKRWRGDIIAKIDKKDSHRALDDIYESIKELQLYRKEFLQLST